LDWDDFLIPLSKWALNYSFPAHAEKDKKDLLQVDVNLSKKKQF
jgi:hypothetical protein